MIAKIAKKDFLLIKQAFLLFIIMILITGCFYPLVVSIFANLFFPKEAKGSLIEYNGKIIGSQWIGQSFSSERYFWSRPSATDPMPYNGVSSKGSNFGPSNPIYIQRIKERINLLKDQQLKVQAELSDPSLLNSDLMERKIFTMQNETNKISIPNDLVMASGSGLDPDISPSAAYFQAERIAKSRNLSLEMVHHLISLNIKNRTFGILGEPRVNVLDLNIALDGL